MSWNKCLLAVFLVALLSSHANAALITASDNASNAPYGNGWQTGDNGGTGWGSAWTLSGPGDSNPSHGGFFVGSSVNNSGSDDGTTNGAAGDGDINTSGVAWGMYANNSQIVDAVRSFARPMQAGDTFSIDMDNGGVDDLNGTVGVGLQTSGGTDIIEVYFKQGTGFYQVEVNNGTPSVSTLSWGNEGLNIKIDLLAGNAYQVTLKNRANTSTTLSGTYTGTIDRLRLFNAFAGETGARDAYFNNLSVVPEPSSLAIAAVGAIFIGALFFRRKGF